MSVTKTLSWDLKNAFMSQLLKEIWSQLSMNLGQWFLGSLDSEPSFKEPHILRYPFPSLKWNPQVRQSNYIDKKKSEIPPAIWKRNIKSITWYVCQHVHG